MKSGTEAAPLRVELTGPKVIQVRTEGDAGQRESKAAEWSAAVIALFALGVAVWQLIYFRQQLGMMNATIRDAKDAAHIAERAAKATEDSVKAMQSSDEQQLRAYVSIALDWGDVVLTTTAPFAFKFILVNHGRSPAKEVGYRAIVECVEIPMKDRPDLKEMEGPWNEKRLTLFPAGNSDKNTRMNCMMNWTPGIQQITGIQHGRLGLLFGIEIQYLDVFGPKPHFTQEFFLFTRDGVSTVPTGSRVS